MSAKEVAFYPAFLCLFVCLLSISPRNHIDWVFVENFTREVPLDQEVRVNNLEVMRIRKKFIWSWTQIHLNGGLLSPGVFVEDCCFLYWNLFLQHLSCQCA